MWMNKTQALCQETCMLVGTQTPQTPWGHHAGAETEGGIREETPRQVKRLLQRRHLNRVQKVPWGWAAE